MSEYQQLVSRIKGVAQDLSTAQKTAVLKALPELKKAYERQQGSGRRIKGRGFLEWLSGAFSDVNQWLKDNKILSKVAGPVLNYIIPAAATLFGTPVSGAATALAGQVATEGLKSLGYGRTRKIRGGDSRLSINPVGQRLMGRGMTHSYIGIPTMTGNGQRRVFKGGKGIEFYSPSSEFGKIKV